MKCEYIVCVWGQSYMNESNHLLQSKLRRPFLYVPSLLRMRAKQTNEIIFLFFCRFTVNSEANARRITMVESCFGSSGEVSFFFIFLFSSSTSQLLERKETQTNKQNENELRGANKIFCFFFRKFMRNTHTTHTCVFVVFFHTTLTDSWLISIFFAAIENSRPCAGWRRCADKNVPQTTES